MPACPHCHRPITLDELRQHLTPQELASLWAAYRSSKRKVRTGGHNGGRPRKQPA